MQRFGRQLGAFALLAVLVRVLVPAGYMVAEAGTPDGRYLVVQMCDAHGDASQVIDLDTGKIVEKSKSPGKSEGKGEGSSCMFAMATPMASPPPAQAEPVVFGTTVDAHLVSKPDVVPGRGIAAPPPPATGPPSLI